jgi:hypothetical protein
VTYVSALHHGDTSALCVPSRGLPASVFFLPSAFGAGFFAAAGLGSSVGLGQYGIRGVDDQSGREPTLREETVMQWMLNHAIEAKSVEFADPPARRGTLLR